MKDERRKKKNIRNDFNNFPPKNELCRSFHQKHQSEMEWEMEECPETFVEGTEVAAVEPVEVYHVNEVLKHFSRRSLKMRLQEGERRAYDNNNCANDS